MIAGDQVLDLATRQADLAIRFFRPTSNQLVAARVGQFNMSIFAAPGYIEQYGLPQELDDLREHHIVDHTTLHSLPAMKPWSEVVERSPNVVLRTNSSLLGDRGREGVVGPVDLPDYVSKTRTWSRRRSTSTSCATSGWCRTRRPTRAPASAP